MHYLVWKIASKEHVNRRIADVCSGDESVEVIIKAIYTLAHAGAVDAGADMESASKIANEFIESIYG